MADLEDHLCLLHERDDLRVGLTSHSHLLCKLGLQAVHDIGGNVVLDFEYIREVALVDVRPELCLRARLDQPRCHANPVSGDAHRPFEKVADLVGVAHLGNSYTILVELHCRTLRDDAQIADRVEQIVDFVGYAICKEPLLGIRTVDLERHDGD